MFACGPHEPVTAAAGNGGFGAKPEAADLEHELLLSAENSRSDGGIRSET